MPSNHLILSSLSPAFNLSQLQGLFKWVSSSHRVANYWSFSFGISPSRLKVSCSYTYPRLFPSRQLHWKFTDPFHQGLILWGWSCWTTTLFQWKWSLDWDTKSFSHGFGLMNNFKEWPVNSISHQLSCVWLFCDPMDCSLPGFFVHWNCPGKNTGVGCRFLPQRIFLTQQSNLRLSPALAGWFFTTVPPGKPS